MPGHNWLISKRLKQQAREGWKAAERESFCRLARRFLKSAPPAAAAPERCQTLQQRIDSSGSAMASGFKHQQHVAAGGVGSLIYASSKADISRNSYELKRNL